MKSSQMEDRMIFCIMYCAQNLWGYIQSSRRDTTTFNCQLSTVHCQLISLYPLREKCQGCRRGALTEAKFGGILKGGKGGGGYGFGGISAVFPQAVPSAAGVADGLRGAFGGKGRDGCPQREPRLSGPAHYPLRAASGVRPVQRGPGNYAVPAV